MKTIPVRLPRRLRASILAALLATATCLISSGAAAADKTDATESESTAWSALELAIKPKQPPAWREKPPSETEYKGYMLRQADVALERVTGYLVKFPGGAHASEARSGLMPANRAASGSEPTA